MCVRGNKKKKTVTSFEKCVDPELEARRCKQTLLFRCFGYNEFLKEGSPFCDARFGVNEPWMLSCFTLTKLLLWRGKMKESCQGTVIAKSLLIDVLSPARRSNGASWHSQQADSWTSFRQKENCRNTAFYLLLTFDTCVSIRAGR